MVDASLVHYLQRGTITIELHQALGNDFRTLAAAKVNYYLFFYSFYLADGGSLSRASSACYVTSFTLLPNIHLYLK